MLCNTSSYVLFIFFVFSFSGDHRDLHSFPTRRSSDLLDQILACLGFQRSDLEFTPALDRIAAPGMIKRGDRKSTRLNSSHLGISYAVFCLKKKKKKESQLQECHQTYIDVRLRHTSACV